MEENAGKTKQKARRPGGKTKRVEKMTGVKRASKKKRPAASNVTNFCDGYWEWFERSESPTYKVTGKYLFFSRDRELLIRIANEELETGGFHHAKTQMSDVAPPTGEYVLCLYYKDDSRKRELAAKYPDSHELNYRYWKSDADTHAGKYSEEFLKRLSPDQRERFLTQQSKIRNFESNLAELFSDDERIDTMLSLEKKNRGVDQKQLAFAGLSDVSAQKFCSMKAVLRARESEKMYFENYLRRRLYYANELKMLESWPRSDAEILEAGQSITFEQVEAIEKSHYGNMALPDETSEVLPIEIEIEGAGADYATRGRRFESSYAEKYHKFMWYFPYGRYVFLAIPDGITNDFVYEFKSGSKAIFRSERMEEAAVQADLYGFFFGKRMKRIQVYTSDDRRRESKNSLVDEENAIRYLKNFARVDSGEMPRLPPPGKCRKCDFVALCPLYLSSGRQSRGFAQSQRQYDREK